MCVCVRACVRACVCVCVSIMFYMIMFINVFCLFVYIPLIFMCAFARCMLLIKL